MTEYFKNIIGNEKLKSMLTSYVKNSNMPHAFVVEGAFGSGKKLIAKSVLAALSCKNKSSSSTVPCMECINCEKIFSAISPDVIMLDTNSKSSIGVELIRELKNHTYMSSNELEYKAYVLDEADKMTVQAQNAFLKILEEPVTNVLYFLLCENSQMLLPTIISRAPIIRTSPIQCAMIEQYLCTSVGMSEADAHKIAAISGGNIGKALLLKEKNAEYEQMTEFRDRVYSFLCLHSPDTKKHEFILYVSSFDEKNNNCIAFLRGIYSAMRDIILKRSCSLESFDFFTDKQDITKFEKMIKVKYAKKICILIEQTIEQLYLNQGASSVSSIMQNFAIKAWSARNQ